MANLTKEKILDLASNFFAESSTFEGLNEPNWITAILFYNNGINDFARALISEMEDNNG